jgi:hypothetical protein
MPSSEFDLVAVLGGTAQHHHDDWLPLQAGD